MRHRRKARLESNLCFSSLPFTFLSPVFKADWSRSLYFPKQKHVGGLKEWHSCLWWEECLNGTGPAELMENWSPNDQVHNPSAAGVQLWMFYRKKVTISKAGGFVKTQPLDILPQIFLFLATHRDVWYHDIIQFLKGCYWRTCLKHKVCQSSIYTTSLSSAR